MVLLIAAGLGAAVYKGIVFANALLKCHEQTSMDAEVYDETFAARVRGVPVRSEPLPFPVQRVSVSEAFSREQSGTVREPDAVKSPDYLVGHPRHIFSIVARQEDGGQRTPHRSSY